MDRDRGPPSRGWDPDLVRDTGPAGNPGCGMEELLGGAATPQPVEEKHSQGLAPGSRLSQEGQIWG